MLKEQKTKIYILTAIYLVIFFGTESWAFILIFTKGFMMLPPTYLESILGLIVMCLYTNTYVIWLYYILKWEKSFHMKVQIIVFIVLGILHFGLWYVPF